MKRKNYLKLLCLFALLLCSGHMQALEKRHLNIIFIGNSITYGAGLSDPTHNAPPVYTALFLGKQPSIGEVKYSNQGVSGCTTVDYNRLPISSKTKIGQQWSSLSCWVRTTAPSKVHMAVRFHLNNTIKT